MAGWGKAVLFESRCLDRDLALVLDVLVGTADRFLIESVTATRRCLPGGDDFAGLIVD